MLAIFIPIIFILLIIALYLYLNRNSDYWKIRNVPFIPPIPVLGNLKSLILLKRSPGQFIADLHNAPEAEDHRFFGFFLFNNEPGIIIRDPELVKNIIIKDFDYFSSRNLETNEFHDPVGAKNMFVIRGSKWKYLRAQLSPAFTSGKLKLMFPMVKNVASELVGYIVDNNITHKEKSYSIIETKSTASRYTIDVISACAFGIKSNTFKDLNSPFKYYGDKMFDMTITRSYEVRTFSFMHWIAKKFKCYFMQKESTNFFRKIFWETIQEREKNSIIRNDFIDTLIKMKNEPIINLADRVENAEDEMFEFKDDLLLAQPIFFFTAGFETSSTTICLALYELALHPHIQEKLRREIIKSIEENGGELTYEGLFEIKYLSMVVLETLRKYPPMPFIDRLCTVDYQIPDSDVIIRKGTPVYISLYEGLHYDEKNFPSPEKFDPERFNDENKDSFHPYSFLPFGDGPHMCIGRRFGFMSVKTAICYVLRNFKVEICEKTTIPLEIDNRSSVVTPKNGVYLNFIKI